MGRSLLNKVAVAALTLCSLPGHAMADAQDDSSRLLNLSLQQLTDVEVTSVSKKSEKASQAAAAVYVITQEDIRRSGLQSVPELLRMVPGLQVAQSGSQNWAVTSRGFDGEFSNKLLVMIDGRTIYTPVYSGVQWDIQNLMLEDVERIEVVRGPGATLWGANAVNGVINIITKNARDTQGTLLTAAAGNQERAAVGGRYGGTAGDLSYRTYGQSFDNAPEQTIANPVSNATQGSDAHDGWHNAQGGFRLDWNVSSREQETLQGDAYQGVENAQRFLPVTSTVNPNLLDSVSDTDTVSGMNMLGRWKHGLDNGSDMTLQAYYDDVIRQSQFVQASQHTQTFDMDFQHNLSFGSRNDVTWGLEYRRVDSGFGNSFYIGFQPEDFYENLYSGFLQDKIALAPDELFLTLGTKLEHNDFSGFEWEPSGRIAWTPTPNQTVWSAVSRAVHTPNQADQNVNLVEAALPGASGHPTTILAELGLGTASASVVTSYELGYRIQPRENVSVDLTGFVNDYRNLASSQFGAPTVAYDPVMGAYVYAPSLNTNDSHGQTRGVEAAATWQVQRNWKLSAAYTLYNEDLAVVGDSLTTASGTAPRHQFNLRSYIDLPRGVQWDTMVYYVDRLPTVSDGFGDTVAIPAYTRLDMRLGWTPLQGLDLSLIGQNLLQSQHEEFSPFLYQTPEEIGRSVLAKAVLRF